MFEFLSAGNLVAVRPEANAFSGTYSYLAHGSRLQTRFPTTAADLVRPSDGATALDQVAAKNLPTAGTMNEQVVALNTGEVVRSAVDLAIRGRGIDFVLQRYYSSAIAGIGPFGRNTDSPLFARVHKLPNGDVALYDGTGRKDVFTGGTTPPAGVLLDMETDGAGNVLVQYPDNTRLYFDALGRPANASGGCEGCIATVTDFDNRVVAYKYDTAARLTNVQVITERARTGSTEAALNMTRVTQIGYGPANLPTSITAPDGATTTIVRDARGNPSTTTDPSGVTSKFGFDGHGQLNTATDPRTGVTTYTYVPDGVKKGYIATVTNADGTTHYDVDGRGNVQTVTAPGNKINHIRGQQARSDRGAADLRILWTSDPGLVSGSLAPIIDPDTCSPASCSASPHPCWSRSICAFRSAPISANPRSPRSAALCRSALIRPLA